MPIWQFDRMSARDQAEYVRLLFASIESAAFEDHTTPLYPTVWQKVKMFSETEYESGLPISGMKRFELNLAYATVADIRAAEKNPAAARVQVEDILYLTLFENGVKFPETFRPSASNFQRQDPLGEVWSLARAQETLKWNQSHIPNVPPQDIKLQGCLIACDSAPSVAEQGSQSGDPDDSSITPSLFGSAAPETEDTKPERTLPAQRSLRDSSDSTDKALLFWGALIAIIAISNHNDNSPPSAITGDSVSGPPLPSSPQTGLTIQNGQIVTCRYGGSGGCW
jgi:hypothetical protein